jgi:hypothetical protein
MTGIPNDVRKKAIEVLWTGIRESLHTFNKKIAIAKETNMHAALLDLCRQEGFLLNISEHDSLDAGKVLLLENSVLFDQLMESSIKDNNVYDAMHLMRLKLSQMRV